MIAQSFFRSIHAITISTLVCGVALLSSCNGESSNQKIPQQSGEVDKQLEEAQKATVKQQETLERIVKLLDSNSERIKQLESAYLTTGQNLVQSNEKLAKLLESRNNPLEKNGNPKVLANGEQIASLIPEDAIYFNVFNVETTSLINTHPYRYTTYYSNDGTYKNKNTEHGSYNDSSWYYSDSPKNKCALCSWGVFVIKENGTFYFKTMDQINSIELLPVDNGPDEKIGKIVLKKEDRTHGLMIKFKPS